MSGFLPVPNLTWTWKGQSDLVGPQENLGSFSALTTLGGTSVDYVDYFVSQAHSKFLSGTDVSQDFTQVPAPAAPEPGTLPLLGFGGISLFARRRLRLRLRMRAGA
jgi:hypothetical protein